MTLLTVKYAPPWVPFKKYAKHGRAMMDQLVNKPFEYVKREMVRSSFEWFCYVVYYDTY